MSLTITQRPNQSGVWVAAKNPVIYKGIRQDYEIYSISSGAGSDILLHLFDASDLTSFFVTGDTVYITTHSNLYTGFATVVSSSYSAPFTFVDVSGITYTSSGGSGSFGFVNIITRRPNYYVGVGVYKSADNTLIGTVNYYPTTIGLLTMDVSSVLLSVLDPSLPSGTITEGFINDSTAYQGFYIKYTEFWTGSAESATSDIANISYGVIAANQIGSTCYLTTTIINSKFDYFKLMIGEYYCLSIINNSASAIFFLKKTWFGLDGIAFCISYINTGSNSALFTYTQKLISTSQDTLFINKNIVNAGTTAWTINANGTSSVSLTTLTISQTAVCPCFIKSGSTVQISWASSITGSGVVDVYIYSFNKSGSLQSVNLGASGVTGSQSGTVSITPGGDAYYVGIRIINGSAFTKTATGLLKLIIADTSLFNRVDFNACTLDTSYTEVDFSSITANIITSCNPITLFWRNSQGGESSWTFGYVQDSVQKLQDPTKNTWLTLYEQNLTLAQFNALNELFSVNQIYQTPIIELTTSIDKTAARVGQQVYTVDSNGNKIGVIVIGGENKTRTRNRRHQFQVTIELPEIFG